MVAKTETEESGKLDSLKFLIAIALLVGGIWQFYFFAEESQLYRILGLLAMVVMAMLVMYTTRMGYGLWLFARDARTEVRKVIWPTRQETVQTTLMVVVMVFLVGIMLWLIDMVLRWAILLLTGQGG
ncbi:MAG: preprotein translocase subunit SecE [endosymbiont of Galathealinum brachiosum]|uniref:Protein translocase subunit SecE n=1 Tax=endosymbiont of Galathealinum brachiosum TaxID=2200906 RepID=A0A370DA46_9GAMM|nr:MAG: preprotein translocase subunit SecE [endosymbiont of Galathealinum brachiosum]